MRLKNFHPIKKIYKGFHVLELIDMTNGAECIPFSLFQKDLIDNPSSRNSEIRPATLKIAKTAVAKFIDYLSEMGVYENGYDTLETKLIIKQYPSYLTNSIDENFPKLKEANEALLAYKPKLAPKSQAIHINYVNAFLTLSEKLAREDAEILAAKAGLDTSTAYKPLFEDVWKFEHLSNSEKSRLRQSKIGGCIREVGGIKLKPCKALHANADDDASQAPKVEVVDKAFPIDSVLDLINNTSSKRNKALFAFLACTGLRMNEGLQVRWSDLDLINGEVRVSPATRSELERIFVPEDDIKNILSWKGRTTDRVFLIAALEELMWKTLREYQASDEYQSSPLHDFIFVYIEGKKKGQP